MGIDCGNGGELGGGRQRRKTGTTVMAFKEFFLKEKDLFTHLAVGSHSGTREHTHGKEKALVGSGEVHNFKYFTIVWKTLVLSITSAPSTGPEAGGRG